MKRIVFMGSKPIGYQCFKYLIDNSEKLDIDIVGLFTKSRKEFTGSSDLKSLAEKAKIDIFNELDELLSIEHVDIIISVQYHKILKKEHIDKAQELAINLHMAPLPEYRGSNQFSFAIINEEKEFGTTIHRLEESIDGGKIICESRFPIDEDINVQELYQLTFEKSVDLFKSNIGKIINGEYNLVDQKDLLTKRNTSFHLRKEISDIKRIDLNWEEEKIDRYLRATSMPGFEPPYTFINGKKVFLLTEEIFNEVKL